MNSRLILVASLALALAGPAFAQDSYSNPSQPQTEDQKPPVDPEAAPTDEQMMPTDTATTDTATTTTDTAITDNQTAVPTPKADLSGTAAVIAPSVPPIISANAPQPVAANHYDPRKDLQQKVYPTVDRGHVEGDPPVIDHSKDIAPVMEPTTSSVSVVPPGG